MEETTEFDLNKLTSVYHEGSFQIFRLHDLWVMCNRKSKEGNFTDWEWALDNIWRELSIELKHLNKYGLMKEYYEKKKEILHLKKSKNAAMLYQRLGELEVFLRDLQDESGKGSKKKKEYENLM